MQGYSLEGQPLVLLENPMQSNNVSQPQYKSEGAKTFWMELTASNWNASYPNVFLPPAFWSKLCSEAPSILWDSQPLSKLHLWSPGSIVYTPKTTLEVGFCPCIVTVVILKDGHVSCSSASSSSLSQPSDLHAASGVTLLAPWEYGLCILVHC